VVDEWRWAFGRNQTKPNILSVRELAMLEAMTSWV